MIVRFDEIPEEGLWLDVHETSWVPADEVAWQGPFSCRLYLSRSGKRVLLEGELRLTLLLDCDRCLEQFSHPLEAVFKIDFELLSPDEARSLTGEHECSSEEMDVVHLDEPQIDIFAVLAQQVYLAVPEKRLCSDACLGLCSACGANKNVEQCDCRQDSDSSPFGVLAKLKH